MSKFESEVQVAENVLDHVMCSCEQFSFQTCLESGDGSETFGNYGDSEFQTAGAVILNALD